MRWRRWGALVGGVLTWLALTAAQDVPSAVKDTSIGIVGIGWAAAGFAFAWKLFRDSQRGGGDKDDGRWQGKVEQALDQQVEAFRNINAELKMHGHHLEKIVDGWAEFREYMRQGRAAMDKIDDLHHRKGPP